MKEKNAECPENRYPHSDCSLGFVRYLERALAVLPAALFYPCRRKCRHDQAAGHGYPLSERGTA